MLHFYLYKEDRNVFNIQPKLQGTFFSLTSKIDSAQSASYGNTYALRTYILYLSVQNLVYVFFARRNLE